MVFASKLDEYGRPAWIAATVLGFWLYWPVGLAVLLFLSWSGRMRSWRGEKFGRWQTPQGQSTYNCGPWGSNGGRSETPTSGNRAFDEYRAETLRRLEEEQREFVDYLERLRQAKDKAEFDQFMAERRRPPTSTDIRDQP